jgi:hypothetical protein
MQGVDRNNNVNIGRKHTGRRALLTAAGPIAAGGLPAAVSALEGIANGGRRKRAWWVKAVDRPTLGQKTSEFGRFSGNNIFAIHKRLKTEREGAGSFEAEQGDKVKRLAGWLRDRKPGYSLADHQLSEGSWTLVNSTEPGAGLLSWTYTEDEVILELEDHRVGLGKGGGKRMELVSVRELAELVNGRLEFQPAEVAR